MFIIQYFFALLGILAGLLTSNFQGAQTKASDTERKSDINSIYQKLEEHYNEWGEYPTEDELVQEYDEQLPGIDPEALVDPNGKNIQDGDYKYSPTSCSATGCMLYELSAKLEDGSTYTKISLN